MKYKIKMKNGSQRCDINRPGPKQGHKHTKCKVSPCDNPYICKCKVSRYDNPYI